MTTKQFKLIGFTCGAIIISGVCCKAATIPDNLAVKAIMGEACGEGYKGMLAVAGAIRNRGTLQGVYGVKATHIYKEPAYVWANAKKAWKESAKVDITKGANHWEGTDFKRPAWSMGMKITLRYKKHIFYKS